MRIFFVSTFVGTFLPASVGGDAVRAYSLARLNVAAATPWRRSSWTACSASRRCSLMALVGLALARDLAGNVDDRASLGRRGGVCAS